MIVTCGFSGLIILQGGAFLGLILFLIYLGGMLVVFAYSAALASDRYPSAGGGQVAVLAVLVGGVIGFWGEGGDGVLSSGVTVQPDLVGVAGLYESSWAGLLVGGFGLFVCLFVVLCVVRGLSRGALRAVSEGS